MYFNYTNRSSLVNSHTVVPSIDRIKVTLEVTGKTPKGYDSKIIVDNFTRLPNVKKNHEIVYGLYFVYKDSKNVEYLERFFLWSIDKGKDYAKEIKLKIHPPKNKIILNNRVCYYTGNTKILTHYEYRIIGWNKKARIIKNSNHLIIELNDVLQQYPNKTPYKLIREALEFMLKVNVLKLNVKEKNIKVVRRKAYRLMKKIKLSEVEIAFDFNPEYSHLFHDQLLLKFHKNISFEKYENTIYWNNSFPDSKRWKYKLYDRSLKDRKDIYIDELRKTYKGLSKIELSKLVPEQINEDKFDDDIYRFEVTLGRNKLNELEDLAVLKHKPKDIIQLLSKQSYAGISKFFSLFDYQEMKVFIEKLKSTVTNTHYLLIENTTKKNYKRLLSSILCKYKPWEVYRSENKAKLILPVISVSYIETKKTEVVASTNSKLQG